ncbi:MAG: glycosyltransferase family 4 protein [Candidatus Omnitrophica bacterium]|nr:glycosyltransferase family 4 protein [Candidatus Omnitrophota bacterium]
MSRIFILVNDESTIYNFRRELIEMLISLGHQVIAAFPRGGNRTDEIEKMGCTYIDLPMERKSKNPLKDLLLNTKIKKLLKSYLPDVLLTFTIKPNLYGGHASGKLGIPQIANITGLGTAIENSGWMKTISLIMYKIFMKETNCIFFQNAENMRFLQNKGIAVKSGKLIPGSGVNLKKFTVLPYPDDAAIRFTYIGRIMKQKGIEELLKAAKTIKKVYSNVEFHIVGPCEEDYGKVLSDHEKDNIIKYHGEANNTFQFHEQSHCTIHPSYYPEGMSNVLLESAACGRPIITTDRSGCKEIVDDGINGFLIKQKSAKDLIEKIEQFLNLDNSVKEKMGLAGREKVEMEFDRDIVIKAYLNELERCISKWSPHG